MRKYLISVLILFFAFSAYGFHLVGSGIVTGGGGSATNYTQDADIISWWMLEEESGTRLDGSANDNDLTAKTDGAALGRSATHIQGSYSADFTGTDYEALYRTDAGLAPSTFPGKSTTGGQGAFSVGGWFYLADTGTERYLIAKGNTASETCSFTLYYDGTNVVFEVSTAGWYSTTITGTTALSATTWYHIVGVYTGAHIQLWLGTAAGASAQDQTAVEFSDTVYRGAGDFLIGAKLNNGNTPHNGLIDEVFIFSDALNGTEIEEIRAHGLAGER